MPTPPDAGYRDLLEAVGRQWRLATTVYVAIVVTALVGSLVLPRQYRAASRVLLTSNRASVTTNPEKPSDIQRSSDVSDAEMGSQVEIIGSVELVAATLRELGVTPPPPATSLVGRVLAWPGAALRRLAGTPARLTAEQEDDPLYVLAAATLTQMEVAPVKRSNVIEIAFTARDPVWARDFVNRLTQLYLDRHGEMQQTSGAQDFFERQSEYLKTRLGDSEIALRDLRQKAGTIAGQKAEIEKLVAKFTEDLARTRVERQEVEKRVAYLDTLRTSGGRFATPELLKLESERAGLVGKYRDDSERVRSLDAEIRAMREALGRYDTVVGGDGGGTRDQTTSPVAARAQLAAVRGREDALAQTVEEYRQQLEQIEAQGFDLARLERQVKIDEDAYLSYVRAAEQSRLTSALEQSRLLRLNVVDRAQLPREPIAPRRGRILLFALVGGLAVAVGVALVRDWADTTVKSARDVQRYGHVEVLTVVRRGR